MRTIVFCLFTLFFCLISFDVYTNKGGPTDGVAGNPPLNETCAEAGCHAGSSLNSGGGTASVICKDSLNNVVSSYIPNHQYQITVSVSEGSKTRYGFEAVVMKGIGGAAARLGTISLAISDTGKTQLFNGFVMHKLSGIDFSGNTGSWIFNWLAPSANFGLATVYAAFNASNKNGENTGDEIYTRSLALEGTGTPVGVKNYNNNTLSRVYPNPAKSHISFQLNSTSTITIFDLSGKEVMFVDNVALLNSVDIEHLPPGLYLAKVSDNKQFSFYKFIKQ